MRDIYLIDFENVASEGLSGITYLSEEDQVIIFYSNNSNRLTMKMHILIGKSVCNLSYFEVTVGGKNALDHQISTYLGYLIGTGAAERNYYIVSRDMGYKHVANFWTANRIGPKVRCIDAIKGASRLERKGRETLLQAVPHQAETEAAQTEATQTEPIQTDPAQAEPPEASTVEAPDVTAVDVLPLSGKQETVDALPQPEIPAIEAAQAEIAAEESTEEVSEVPAEGLPSPAAEVPVVESQPEAESPAEEAQPQAQKRTYRSRTRVRSKNRSKNNNSQEHTEAPAAEAPEAAESSTEPAPVTVQTPTPQPQSAAEEKKPDQKKKPSQKSSQTKSKVAKKEAPNFSGNFDQLSALIAPYPKLQENVLRDLIANNKRQILCNTLRKHLGQEKGLALYNEIKRAAWH